VAFSPDGTLVASGGWRNEHTVKLWDVNGKRQVATLVIPDWPPAETGIQVAFHPAGNILATGTNEIGAIILWDLGTFEKITTLQGHSQTILSLAFSPDGQILASGSEDNTIKLWDVANSRELLTLDAHANDVASVAFSADGSSLASGSSDQTIRLWNIREQCNTDLNDLLYLGCCWLHSYLTNNPTLSQEDRDLCCN